MASHAGVIFAGEVASIARHDERATLKCGFAWIRAVLGCRAGAAYTVREWAGRWVGHGARYQVGQRLLMLLAPPGAAGLSAPVYGVDGAVPITPGAVGTATDLGLAPGPLVDLRLLAARVAVGATDGGTRHQLHPDRAHCDR